MANTLALPPNMVSDDKNIESIFEMNGTYTCASDESSFYSEFLLPIRAEGMNVWRNVTLKFSARNNL